MREKDKERMKERDAKDTTDIFQINQSTTFS